MRSDTGFTTQAFASFRAEGAARFREFFAENSSQLLCNLHSVCCHRTRLLRQCTGGWLPVTGCHWLQTLSGSASPAPQPLCQAAVSHSRGSDGTRRPCTSYIVAVAGDTDRLTRCHAHGRRCLSSGSGGQQRREQYAGVEIAPCRSHLRSGRTLPGAARGS